MAKRMVKQSSHAMEDFRGEDVPYVRFTVSFMDICSTLSYAFQKRWLLAEALRDMRAGHGSSVALRCARMCKMAGVYPSKGVY